MSWVDLIMMGALMVRSRENVDLEASVANVREVQLVMSYNSDRNVSDISAGGFWFGLILLEMQCRPDTFFFPFPVSCLLWYLPSALFLKMRI